jgi:hypothetical protein
MQLARNEFLPGSRFTAHQDRRIRVGNLLDHRPHVLHRLGISEQRAALRSLDFTRRRSERSWRS